MRRGMAFALAVPVAAFAFTGCGSSSKDKSSSGSDTKAAAAPAAAKHVGAPGAKVSFVSPKEGATVSGKMLDVKVKLKNFKLAPQDVGKAPKEGEGHLHFSMDNGKYDHPKYSDGNGKLAVKLGVDGKYSPSVTKTIVYSGLPKGKHELEVYLANNDHSNTGVEAKTEFTLK